MKKFLFIWICAAVSGYAQLKIFDKPLSPRIANYNIKAKLLPAARAVEASWELNWWNASADTIRELQFHLYLNAFKNEKSTFFREGGGEGRSNAAHLTKEDWGYIDIKALRTEDDEDLTKRIEFIYPDDGNADDQSAIRVVLSKPILPQKSIQLHCEFYSKLPRVYARTGFTEDNFFMVGQWFPKIAVWRNGAWNCHQFHAWTEFFADFGVYDMELTVPKEYVVGANAVLVDKREGDSASVYTYHQEDVIDAVWAASPDFKEIKQKITVEGTGKDVEVTYLLSPTREGMIDRYEEFMAKLLQYYNEWYGEYPYRNLTIVDPPSGEEFTSGGMEYPTLITTGSFIGPLMVDRILGTRWLEVVVAHEFAHNYFQSLVATNEFEDPWMDEGFTSFTEHRAVDRFFAEKNLTGSYANLLGAPVNSMDYFRGGYYPHPRDGLMSDAAWKIPPGFYQTAAYSKPTLFLTTLENYLGEQTFNKIMRTYFERWHFKHPKPKDFTAIVNEMAGQDLNWFFDQVIYTNKTTDYEVSKIENAEAPEDGGWFDEGGEKKFAENQKSDEKKYHGTVRVRNNGDGYFPTPILIRFANGDSLIERWDGKGAWREFTYDKNSKIISAVVDPHHVNTLDFNWGNNSKTVDRSELGITRYTLRFMFWVETLFQYLTMFV